MEILTFLIGILFGFIMKKFSVLIKSILSLGTSFIIIKLIHPEIFLLPLLDWTWGNVLYGYNFWFQSIIAFIFSYALFYFIFPKIIIYFISDRLFLKYNHIFKNKKRKKTIEKIANIKIKKIIIFLNELLGNKNKKLHSKEPINVHEANEIIVFLFCLSIHLFICSIYFRIIYDISVIISFMIWFILIIWMLIIIPSFTDITNIIHKTINNEHNRNNK